MEKDGKYKSARMIRCSLSDLYTADKINEAKFSNQKFFYLENISRRQQSYFVRHSFVTILTKQVRDIGWASAERSTIFTADIFALVKIPLPLK